MDVFVLTEGKHLNSYSKKIKYQINKKEFNRLDEIIIEELNS